MKNKTKISIAILIIFIAGISSLAYCLVFQEESSTFVNTDPETEKPVENSNIIAEDTDFFWGIEAGIGIDDATNLTEEVENIQNIINNDIKTKYVKFRFREDFIVKESTKYTQDLCMPSIKNCINKIDLDEVAKLYQQNNWKMIVMMDPRERKANESREEYIHHCVDFYSWFIENYESKVDLKYVELVNAPARIFTWDGAGTDLAKTNRLLYERIKPRYPDIQIGTPGFEYQNEITHDDGGVAIELVEDFIARENQAKFDVWLFHGYPSANIPASEGTDKTFLYPPTRISKSTNKYAGIPGMIEIREKLDENGFTEVEMIDSEHLNSFAWGLNTIDYDSTNNVFLHEDIDAAFTIQELVLKRTLTDANAKPILSGIINLKLRNRETNQQARTESSWGSLRPDGSKMQVVDSFSRFLSKLNRYSKYEAHISGEFDRDDQIWIEKFHSKGNEELYIFFKPFEYISEHQISFDKKKVHHTLRLEKMPASVQLTDINGNVIQIDPSTDLSLEGKNAPQFLEVNYSNSSNNANKKSSIPTQVPTPQENNAVNNQKCGDGVCGPIEKKNPMTCPEDCK